MTNKFDDIVHSKGDDEKEEDSRKNKEKSVKDDDVKEINIRIKLRPRLIERIIFILIILVLIFLVFRSPFCKVGIGDSNESVELDEPEEVVDVEITQEDETEEEDVSSEEITVDLVINASLSVRAADIIIVNTSSTSYKVDKINFKVINSGDIFRGKIEIFWYDEDDSDVLKDKVRASNPFIVVPAEETMAFSATEFSGAFLNSANEEETFVLELSDVNGNVIDSVEIERTP